eukprot:PRCOL_00000372-RA
MAASHSSWTDLRARCVLCRLLSAPEQAHARGADVPSRLLRLLRDSNLRCACAEQRGRALRPSSAYRRKVFPSPTAWSLARRRQCLLPAGRSSACAPEGTKCAARTPAPCMRCCSCSDAIARIC